MVRMRLTTSRAGPLGFWEAGEVISVSEREAAALEASGSAERACELEAAMVDRELERPRRPRGRPRKIR